MKSLWNGTISFGLVMIPINIYSAVEAKTIGFKMMCGTCKNPIKYERWCRVCNKEVAWENVVKGLEISPGKFFIITKEHLEQLRPKKSETLEIVEFVDEKQINPIFLQNHYYVGPGKNGSKPFTLLRKALESRNKVAIGRFVMREKEYTCAIRPYDEIFLLSTMYYDYEIRTIRAVPQLEKSIKITAGELKLAQQLIDQHSHKMFDISKFKDTFAKRLAMLIKKSAKKKIKNVKGKAAKVKVPTPHETSLMALLKASMHGQKHEHMAKA